jgi:ethanolamine utilization microcompartment shell protein EutS
LLIFAATLFVAAASPGPGIAAIVARVLGRGLNGAVAFTAAGSATVNSDATLRSLTINAGFRFERFAGTLTEYGNSPRLGAALSVGRGSVVRASYGRFYQHPQVATVSGPVLGFALQQGFDILPIPGERDQMWEVGYGIPVRGWTLDFDGFYNQTHNVVDHEVIGNSNLLLPLGGLFLCLFVGWVWGEEKVRAALSNDGYLGTGKVASRSFSADASGDVLALAADDAEIDGDGADATRLEFRAVDRYGAPRPYAGGQVGFDVEGPAVLVGDNPFDFAAAGGAGAVWLRSRPGAQCTVTVRASHPALGDAVARIRVR